MTTNEEHAKVHQQRYWAYIIELDDKVCRGEGCWTSEEATDYLEELELYERMYKELMGDISIMTGYTTFQRTVQKDVLEMLTGRINKEETDNEPRSARIRKEYKLYLDEMSLRYDINGETLTATQAQNYLNKLGLYVRDWEACTESDAGEIIGLFEDHHRIESAVYCILNKAIYNTKEKEVKTTKFDTKQACKHAGIGAGIAFAYSLITTPTRIALNLCAPITYPILGALTGRAIAIELITNEEITGDKQLDNLIIGTVGTMGGMVTATLMLPAAPINLLMEPLQPISSAISGGMLGAGYSYISQKNMDFDDLGVELTKTWEKYFG